MIKKMKKKGKKMKNKLEENCNFPKNEKLQFSLSFFQFFSFFFHFFSFFIIFASSAPKNFRKITKMQFSSSFFSFFYHVFIIFYIIFASSGGIDEK